MQVLKIAEGAGISCYFPQTLISTGWTKNFEKYTQHKESLKEKIVVGKNCIIGMGKIVKKNCTDGEFI